MLNWYILPGTRWFNQMHYLNNQTFAQTMTQTMKTWLCFQITCFLIPAKPAYIPTEGVKSTRPFANCSMDLIMDLPPANGHDSILVVVDQGLSKGVIYPYSILNSALNFHSYFTLQCFWCLPIPYSDISDVFWCFPYSNVFLFRTPMFPMFPAVFWNLSTLWCSPYSDISEILLFHSMLWHFPHLYRCRTFWSYYGLIIIREPFQ